jgi:hypothetical protein
MLAYSTYTPYTSPPKEPPQLYRRFFTPLECEWLDSIQPYSPLSEICLLRILLSRTLEALRQGRGTSVSRRLSLLSAFSAAGVVIASLVRLASKSVILAGNDEFLAELDSLDPDDL